jgi:predicted RND superfamily exporter protein
MGAYLPFELLIKSTDQKSLLTREKLDFLEKLQDQIASETPVYNPSSLIEVIKYLNQQIPLNGSYDIPQSNALISQLVLLYEMEENNKLRYLANINYTEIRVTGKVKILSVNDYAEIERQVNTIFNNLGGSSMNLELEHQGYIPVYIKLTNNVTSSLLYSFLGAFIMISIAMVIFIRKAMITLFCIVTNLTPIAFIVLLLISIGIPIDMGTVMIAAIMFGIAVDDTMHLVHAYNYNRQAGASPTDSINQAINSTNKALLASSVALTIGFLILGMSSVSSLQNFGNLCAAAVAITYLADVLLLPALVKTISKT